ncbi:MAG: LPXTG-site transpeptidase (sortase) family protein [Patiriisocius sp.]|jgi:LPXTG-site transpeptidase (sortase) family protein
MQYPHSFNELLRQLLIRKVSFFFTFFFVILLSYAILFIIDFIPEPIEEDTVTAVEEVEEEPIKEVLPEVEEVKSVVESPLPIKIIFETLDREVTVLNPASRAIVDLDEALLDGAVRHPDSADFSEDGNIFILAHSSYLPNVFNKNFQAFNGIQELTWGDKIRVQSDDMEYVYSVKKTYKAKATEVFVPETPGEANLTLATCNSFGSKDDRFMVEAKLIGEYKI